MRFDYLLTFIFLLSHGFFVLSESEPSMAVLFRSTSSTREDPAWFAGSTVSFQYKWLDRGLLSFDLPQRELVLEKKRMGAFKEWHRLISSFVSYSDHYVDTWRNVTLKLPDHISSGYYRLVWASRLALLYQVATIRSSPIYIKNIEEDVSRNQTESIFKVDNLLKPFGITKNALRTILSPPRVTNPNTPVQTNSLVVRDGPELSYLDATKVETKATHPAPRLPLENVLVEHVKINASSLYSVE